jgi:hypothetical protein
VTESINRTQIRHDTLRAVDAGMVTILVYLALRSGATRAVDLFEERGYVDRGTGTRSLTDAGRTLLAEWDQARAGGAR